MSNATRASAPGPQQVDAGGRAGRTLRIDPPHRERFALRGPLAWTDYVQPQSATSLAATSLQDATALPDATLPPAASVSVHCTTACSAAAVATAAEPCHVSRSFNAQPVLRRLQCDRDVRTGVRRQRFYPEQWRRLQQPAIERLVKAHGQSLSWIGWERSLPLLYLPAGNLSRVIHDLLQVTLRRTKPAGALDRSMCLRVGSQIGVTRSLVLVLEHPRLELSADLMQYINAPISCSGFARPEPPDADELVRVHSLLKALGGSISASRSRDGGTQFRVSVPADDRMTLIKAWLEQAAHNTTARGAAARAGYAAPREEHDHAPVIYQSQFSLFVIGRRDASSFAELSSIDARLQSMSGSGDFVYRAAHSRWLWLTACRDLPELNESEGWLAQRVQQWNCLVEEPLLTERQTATFHGLARAIVAQFDQLLGRRVPPLDMLAAPPPRSRHLRVDRPAAVGPWAVHHSLARLSAARLAAPSQQSAHASLRPTATPSTGQRRWRYPI